MKDYNISKKDRPPAAQPASVSAGSHSLTEDKLKILEQLHVNCEHMPQSHNPDQDGPKAFCYVTNNMFSDLYHIIGTFFCTLDDL